MLLLSRGHFLSRHKSARIVLLTTTGRRTGKPRTWPLAALPTGDGWVVAGSNGGHDQHPSWYLNLLAKPEATVTVEGTPVPVRARVADGEERDRQYRRFVDYLAVYADYERVTARVIPVVFLDPVGGQIQEPVDES